MKKRHSILVVLFLALALGWAQDNSGVAPSGSDAQTRTEPAPAIGPVSLSTQLEENPPISGLDQPSLEPRLAARSFLLPGVTVSQSVDTNIGNSLGHTAVNGVTRGFGTLTLERLWSKYATAVNYLGGDAYFSGNGRGNTLVQQLEAYQRIAWRTGQLSIRDAFSYLPEGSFGYGTFGGAGAYDTGLPFTGPGSGLSGGGFGSGGFFGGGTFGTLGQASRITNVALVEGIQALSPRSSVTLAGSYSLTHFTEDTTQVINGVPTTLALIDSHQISAQAAYNYQVSRHDQLGVLYGFQHFQYPEQLSGDFTAHLWQILYGHRISGRMDLTLGGGPELIVLSGGTSANNTQVTASGRASLRYRLRRGEANLSYSRYTTSGSGIFLGAKSDIARISLSEPLSRQWDATVDVGYAHNSRLQNCQTNTQPTNISSCVSLSGTGVTTSNSYGYFYGGGSAHRRLGRNFDFFISYQYNDLRFDSSFCGMAGGSCIRSSQRQAATAGLDWHPRPIRLD
jgi:hypothetical protein